MWGRECGDRSVGLGAREWELDIRMATWWRDGRLDMVWNGNVGTGVLGWKHGDRGVGLGSWGPERGDGSMGSGCRDGSFHPYASILILPFPCFSPHNPVSMLLSACFCRHAPIHKIYSLQPGFWWQLPCVNVMLFICLYFCTNCWLLLTAIVLISCDIFLCCW